MEKQILHQRENSEETELHFKSNGKKFSDQCIILMKAMYWGRKLNSMIVAQEYKFNDRRLRDCRQWRPDLVKSKWAKDEKDNTLYMEYWVETPKQVTKNDLQKWWNEYQNEPAKVIPIQQNLFP